MEHKTQLLVKHAVGGRTFVDSIAEGLHFEVTLQEDGGWTIAAAVPHSDKIDEVLRLRHELNVFVFEKTASRGTKKTWYYVNEGKVAYEEGLGKLIIRASSKLEYYPSEYSYS